MGEGHNPSDLARPFDSFLISINPDSLAVSVSQQVTDPTYKKLNGIKIEDKIHLSRESLEAHWLYFLSLNEFDRQSYKFKKKYIYTYLTPHTN